MQTDNATLLAKYPRTPYSPWSAAIADGRPAVDMRNFVGIEIVITEKIDGSNVLLHGGRAYARSVTGAGRHGWMGMVRKYHAWKTDAYPELHFYGEDIYGLHTIAYDPVPENVTYYMFAVRREDCWLSWDDVTDHARELDLYTVPVLYRGAVSTASELRSLAVKLMAGKSALGPERKGIVIRRASSFRASEFGDSICKMVRTGHVQVDAQHWSRLWRPCRLLPATI